jgi:tetratricopeptide (TPR) repeat protein
MSRAFPQAQAAYKAGRFIEAANTLRAALRESPTHAPSFHLLGIIEAKQKRFDFALKCFDAAVNLEPKNASYLVDRANVIASMGRPQDAVAAYDLAISLNPGIAEAHSNRGQALRMLGRRPEAIASFERAISLKPNFVDAHCFRSDTLMEMGQFDAAITGYTQTLLLNPAHIPAMLNRGNCQLNCRRYAKAAEDFKRIVDLVPEHAEAHGKRAQALLELDDFKSALAAADRAIVLDGKNPQWHLYRGRALHWLKRFPEALAEFELTTTFKGNTADNLVALGAVYMELQQYDKALDFFDQGIRIDPTVGLWYYNRGVTLQKLRRFDEAIANFDEAIALDPLHASAHWNSSLCYLIQGDPKGWDLYEWRWKLEKGGPDPKLQPRGLPRWQGFEPIEGKRLLLTSEQGLGDTLMFSRYIPLVTAMGAKVSLALPKGLVRVLSSFQDVESIIVRDKPYNLKGFDAFCPLMSLPKIFGTTLDTIPSGKTPYLHAEPALIEKWRTRLAAATKNDPRPRIGLMWSGRNLQSLGMRSMSLATLLGVVDPNFQYVSLQKEIPEEDLALLATAGVPHFGDEQEDFADAAAIVELCDIVITIDTSIAHLSGAMGKETWILLQHHAEWRWLLDRNDSPWYPRARLFRQPAPDDWTTLIVDVKSALRARRSAGD